MFDNSGTSSSLNCIKSSLTENVELKYKISDKYIVNKLLKINGLDKSNFDVVKNIESLIEEGNINNKSIDDNSNKNERTVLGVLRENTNPFDKLIGFRYLYRKLKELYGKTEATRLTGEMYDFSLGISDSTKILMPYCWAFDASKIVLEGRNFGQLASTTPKRLVSYISALNESIHQLSNHLAGAIAISTIFIDSAHLLLIKENKNLEEIKTNKKVRKYIENCFQNFIHSVNHLSRSSAESPFSNISIFDKTKLKTILKEPNMRFYFEEKDMNYIIDTITELQNIFLDFFDKGNPLQNGLPYRFPVTTINISKNEKNEIEDNEIVENISNRDVCRYNIFVSKGSQVASCCFDKNQKILVKGRNKILLGTFENIFSLPNSEYENKRIFHNGNWHHYKKVEIPYNQNYYKITTSNNKTIVVTEDHINCTDNGEKRTTKLTTEDYLLFNTKVSFPPKEHDLNLTYEQGFLIGCFLGDGSYGTRKGEDIYQVNLSLNENCFDKIKEKIDKALVQMNEPNRVNLSTPYNNVYPATINGKNVSKFIKEWVDGEYCYNKNIKLEVLNQSVEFRKGILDGWYETDGGNSNRCYSTSFKMIETMEVVCTSLGLQTTINVSDRTNEKVIIRGEEYNRNYPLFCLRWYENKNKRNQKNVFKTINNSMFFKIKEIEKVNGSKTAYCVEITRGHKEEPYFTLPNGIITHNCRLLSDSNMLDLASQSNSFGGSGMSLGSHRVVTINFNRIALEASSKEEYLSILEDRIKSSTKILKAHKELLLELEKKGLQFFITNGWINPGRLFSTYGVLGIYEAKETLNRKGITTEEEDFTKEILTYLNKRVLEISKEYNLVGNIEQIPAESFCHRLALADKLIFKGEVQDKIYANQFIPLWKSASIWERMETDGKYNQLLTGGGICHLQISDSINPIQSKNIIKKSISSGCEHFALNKIYSICENKHVEKSKILKCPTCNSQKIDYMTRVVGFFTPVSSWSDIKRKEDFEKRTFVKIGETEL